MKRNISLYIAGTKVDLDDQSLILFNYSMGEMTNPTVVKNSYTHQITIKGTNTNNKLFGEIFRLDRQTIFADQYTGAYFDPMRKTPFEIYDETSTCLESGYIKLNSISREGADISYNVTLYGGLGSFLYGLSYNADGSKKTLADLTYTLVDESKISFDQYPIDNGRDLVYEDFCIRAGLTPPFGYEMYPIHYVIGFAPCYNGLPKDFDSDKIIISPSEYSNALYRVTEDGVTYAPYNDLSSSSFILYRCTNKHTEWEIGDLRWYLQRPVISVRAILLSIMDSDNNGGFSVEFEKLYSFRTAAMWMTLPMIATEDRENPLFIDNLLKTTMSPADFLLSFVKTFGLVMTYDNINKSVRIVTRPTFYGNGEQIDLTNRIDRGSQQMLPYVADSKFYQLGGEVAGEFAEEYKADFGKDYACQIVNTGFEFNTERVNITESILFKGAAQVLERSRMFKWVRNPNAMSERIFPLPEFESVKAVLWSPDKTESKEFPMPAIKGINYEYADNGYDAFVKAQFHSYNNEPTDGSNVLLFQYDAQDVSDFDFRVSNDIFNFDMLNEGRPCWVRLPNDSSLEKLPIYRRYTTLTGVNFNCDWGVPQASGDDLPPGAQVGYTLYDVFWKRYLTDLWDADTKVLKCKVNLRGLPKAQDLLGRFFWYEGCLWVLNKVSNYSLTTYDLTECEFIKVNDIANYTENYNW